MNSIVKTMQIVSKNSLKSVKNRSYNNNIWDVAAIDLIHNDFNKIQQLKNEQFQLPFVITKIPPPFCPRCCKYVKKNKCSFDFVNDDDYDLVVNPQLTIRCPVFGKVDISLFLNNNENDNNK